MKTTLIKVWFALACIALSHQQSHAQSFDYDDYYSQQSYSVTKNEDLVYGVGATNYYLYKGSGDQSQRSNYRLIREQVLTADLFEPQTARSNGKRAVLILIPGSGRNGCITAGTCSVDTVRNNKLSTSSAHYITAEGDNYNELNDRSNRAQNFARRGVVVVSPITRYQYQNRQMDSASSYKWTNDSGASLFNGVSTHLEPLVVDLKRLVRWLSKPENASKYNIDPDNIFIMGASGASKMAALTTITATTKLLADDPAQLNPSNSKYQFEVNKNHLLQAQKPIRGAIMFAGDTNGTRHLRLMKPGVGDFMFWHGTTDRAILHGMAETIEEKCEAIGCATQFYSLPGVEHKRTSQGKALHTNSETQVGFTAHVHDFIVNHMKVSGADNRPVISISSDKTQFDEAAGVARIKVVLDKPAQRDIRFTMAADQIREVTRENGALGQYNLVENFIANDRSSTGPVMYDQSTGVVFELASNLPASYRGRTNHNSGPGAGNPVVIPQSSEYLHDDFVGKKQRMTIAKGSTSAVFNVTLVNDTLYEQNECFKVRLLNAQGGARMDNTVETIVINDDDNPSAASSAVCDDASSKNPKVSAVSASVDEGAGRVLVEFEASGSLQENVTVNYRTRHQSAGGGDYTAANGTIVINRNNSGAEVAINITDDNAVESDERFYVDILSVSGSGATIGNASAAVVIVDNDSPSVGATPSISIRESLFTKEASGIANIRVKADRILTQDVVVRYRTKVGTARSRDGDYVYAESTATIRAGRDRVFIPIVILDDFVDEEREDFFVQLDGISSGNATIARGTARVLIVPED